MTTLHDPADYDDPKSQAEEYADFASGDGEGVYRDALIGERIKADSHAHRLREVYVSLDAAADDMTGDSLVIDDLRAVQNHIHAMADWYASYAESLTGLLEEPLIEDDEEHP